jgi:hypothetical protein
MVNVGLSEDGKRARAVDLDVDIGADAVDYNAIAKAGQSLLILYPYANA